MEKTFKTSEIVTVYNALKAAKVTKMDDADKIAIVKIMRSFKPVATAFNDFVEEAREKLQPENFDEIQKKMQNFDSLPDAEKIAVNVAINEYNGALNKAANEELAKDVAVDFAPISEDAFGKLITTSNDLTIETILAVQDVIVA